MFREKYKQNNMKVAVFGATGLVGGVMLEVLAEMNFPVTELIPIASERSAGKKVAFGGREWTVVTPAVGLSMEPALAIFSAGGQTSLDWAPRFAAAGCYVVDNSSAWRMDPTKKLVIPEINGDSLTKDDYIIANPNCSTIQMLVALAPIHREYTIKRIVVSTYQAITGTGVKAVRQMENERAGVIDCEMAYPYTIDKNCIPQCDTFTENGYTKEEMKLVNETHKILDPSITVSPTAIRVPVVGGHSESINVEVEKPFTMEDVRALLENSQGVVVQDNPAKGEYPMARFCQHRNEVFVGRLRRDLSNPQAMNMWVVADNLRKGAATNAVQIAQILLSKGFIV
ncbi:Aspartate-semialdehyde dehydrogenase [Mucinivorans hirudinis]|uniref:Aspartate-semialdehyde dehydrogenase n=1 Tax=Mucinivorans hirudinis TaxID=1433126 RepID=A0A060R7D9_9BACT|nr:Aspartate-semialdehyde dehydrogenase [Mucinivorans hirudinis]